MTMTRTVATILVSAGMALGAAAPAFSKAHDQGAADGNIGPFGNGQGQGQSYDPDLTNPDTGDTLPSTSDVGKSGAVAGVNSPGAGFQTDEDGNVVSFGGVADPHGDQTYGQDVISPDAKNGGKGIDVAPGHNRGNGKG